MIFIKNPILLLLLFSLTTGVTYAQGTIRGKISDKSGETLIGVTVILKSKPSVGAITDLDGNYTLNITDSLEQTIVISYVSYQTIEEKIHPIKGEVIVKDFVLTTSSKELGAVEIVAKSTRAKEYYMENIKKNSSTTIDYISSETMKKTGDATVVSAVARVSGVSTNGGFITVRGIGDRYVKTTINGSRIPTLDPFTNNIKLDLFPASLVDNIIITKTASPDLPGDWAGAYLSVETKDYPEKLAVNIESTVGYNYQTSFKDVISSDRSKTDWIGYDNGFREHTHDNFVSAKIEPSNYETFVALGLGDYFKANGITEWKESGIAGSTYFKLALVQLGLLAPALINDANAVTAATAQFNNGTYRAQAFNIINSGVPTNSKSFANNYNTSNRKAPLNFSQSFSVGNQTNFLGQPLGYIFGFRYSSATLYDPSSVLHTAKLDTFSTVNQRISKETNGWSALLNLSYKLNANNSLSFMFMPNFTGVNSVRKYTDQGEPGLIINGNAQFYEQRKQLVYQLKSENYIPRYKAKIELNASYTNGKSSAPDFKNVQYYNNSGNYLIGNGVGDGVHRYYRYLSDKVFDSRVSVELPLGNKPNLTRKIMFGGSYQTNDKKSDQYDYYMEIDHNQIAANPLRNDDLDGFFSNKFGLNNTVDNNGNPINSIFCYYSQLGLPTDHTFGKSKVAAAYAMADYTIIPAFRISGGIRVEQSSMFTDVYQYDALGYSANDQRRIYNSAVPIANPGKYNEINYLPSANLIYKLNKKEDSPISLRLNFSQTIARPSIREYSDVSNYDYELRAPVFGNSDLKTVHINNYDLRLETYFKNGDNISVSAFYKNFKNHIELVNTGGYTWENVDKSNVKGIELEGKKSITKHFEFRANITLVKSETQYVRKTTTISDGVKTFIVLGEGTRSMFGQAPYIINSIISYTSDSLGLTATLSYNVQGPRLVIASQVEGLPDVYELQRHLLDAKITKKIGKHFSASLTVKDIFNAPIRRSYKYDDGFTVDYDKYRFGTNYLIGVIYKI